MLLRLIGLGDAGEETVAAISQYCIDRGIASAQGAHGRHSIIESRTVVKLFTRAFSHALCRVSDFASLANRSVKEQVMLRAALAFLFFGGRRAEIGRRFEQLCDYREEAPGVDYALLGSASSSVKYFHRILGELDPPEREKVIAALKDGQNEHIEETNKYTNQLGDDYLILPEIPLYPGNGSDAESLEIRNPNIGRELIESLLEDQSKRRQLIYGLGTDDSNVDVVVLAFSVSDAFGSE